MQIQHEQSWKDRKQRVTEGLHRLMTSQFPVPSGGWTQRTSIKYYPVNANEQTPRPGMSIQSHCVEWY